MALQNFPPSFLLYRQKNKKKEGSKFHSASLRRANEDFLIYPVAPYLGTGNFHVEGFNLNQSTVSSLRTIQFFTWGLWKCDTG